MKHYGLNIIKGYVIAFSEDDLRLAIGEAIKENLCYFNATFLSRYIPLESEVISILKRDIYKEYVNANFLELLSEDKFNELIEYSLNSDSLADLLSTDELFQVNVSEINKPHKFQDVLKFIQVNYSKNLISENIYIFEVK